uniref:Uncharacterized protein n=1 Tax=Peronospora matthiolae TaxID=2874970 RepID=A0AAV1U4U2_9STRA
MVNRPSQASTRLHNATTVTIGTLVVDRPPTRSTGEAQPISAGAALTATTKKTVTTGGDLTPEATRADCIGGGVDRMV